MEPTEKAAWIAGLRDPSRYTHTEQALQDEGGHCCLGVLLDLNFPGNWDTRGRFIFDGAEFPNVPPIPLIRKWGLDKLIPADVAVDAVKRALASLNRDFDGEPEDLIGTDDDDIRLDELLMNVNDKIAVYWSDFEIQALLIDELL